MRAGRRWISPFQICRLEALVVRFQKVSQKPLDLHHTFLHPICRVRSIVLWVLAKEKCNV